MWTFFFIAARSQGRVLWFMPAFLPASRSIYVISDALSTDVRVKYVSSRLHDGRALLRSFPLSWLQQTSPPISNKTEPRWKNIWRVGGWEILNFWAGITRAWMRKVCSSRERRLNIKRLKLYKSSRNWRKNIDGITRSQQIRDRLCSSCILGDLTVTFLYSRD